MSVCVYALAQVCVFAHACRHTIQYVCVSVCELDTRCKIAPWLQSKSMQSKPERPTIAEMERGRGREGDRWESWPVSQRIRGNGSLRLKILVDIEFAAKKEMLPVIVADRCINS